MTKQQKSFTKSSPDSIARKSPRPESPGEYAFALHCGAYKLEPVREHRFHPKRRYRFDYAFPADKLAIEIEGGIWSGGRHNRGAGFEADCEKYNLAVKMGWRVLRFSTNQVKIGMAINDVLEIIGKGIK